MFHLIAHLPLPTLRDSLVSSWNPEAVKQINFANDGCSTYPLIHVAFLGWEGRTLKWRYNVYTCIYQIRCLLNAERTKPFHQNIPWILGLQVMHPSPPPMLLMEEIRITTTTTTTTTTTIHSISVTAMINSKWCSLAISGISSQSKRSAEVRSCKT